MKKFLTVVAAIIVIMCGASFWLFKYARDNIPGITVTKLDKMDAGFFVFQNGNFLGSFDTQDKAVAFARKYSQTYVTEKGSDTWVWDNYPQFSVHYDGGEYVFSSLQEAISFGRTKPGSYIFNRANKAVIWRQEDTLKPSHIIEGVPLIAQNPELERGCEVTSLAMLLNYYGIGVSKMDLAEQIKKDPTPYSEDKNGVVTFGNPENGFVGDIYTKANPGLGVYHGPLYDLLKQYIGTAALDLTGTDFSDLYFFIAKDKPVLVITNTTFKPLSNDRFTSWNTEDGPILITYSEHSVLIKGYDQEFIYFNDPLNGNESASAPKAQFIKAWEQMGKQAITYFE